MLCVALIACVTDVGVTSYVRLVQCKTPPYPTAYLLVAVQTNRPDPGHTRKRGQWTIECARAASTADRAFFMRQWTWTWTWSHGHARTDDANWKTCHGSWSSSRTDVMVRCGCDDPPRSRFHSVDQLALLVVGADGSDGDERGRCQGVVRDAPWGLDILHVAEGQPSRRALCRSRAGEKPRREQLCCLGAGPADVTDFGAKNLRLGTVSCLVSVLHATK